MSVTADYGIDELKTDVRKLLDKGIINFYQPIYVLRAFFPQREWICIECELETNAYTLKDRICDLFFHEEWQED